MVASNGLLTIASILSLVLLAPTSGAAQTPGPAPVAATAPPLASPPEPGFVRRGSSAWTILVGGAHPVNLGHSLTNYDFVMQTVIWHKVLTPPLLPSIVRGQLALGVEFVPAFIVRQPQATYAFGFSPIVVRWQLKERGIAAPFLELLGGALQSNDKIPPDITYFNYTAQGGVGMSLAVGGSNIVFGYRLHHISNGGIGPRTPSYNSHVGYAGVTIAR